MNLLKKTCNLPLLLALLAFPHLGQAQAEAQVQPQVQAQAQPQADLRESYVLRANDVVKLSVYEEIDLNSVVTILKTGQAAFPLIGSFTIEGLSLREASEEIRSRYAADYLRYPKVTLTVSEYATEFATVIGQVTKPGTVPIPQIGSLDVGSALATVGGITEMADPENIQLITADGKVQVLSHDSIQGDAGRIIMKSGDKLIVNESLFSRSTVSVIGFVNKPDSYPIPKSGKMDLTSALATAGGLAPEADILKINVITSDGVTRSYSYQEIQAGAAGRIPLQGGDSVVVSKSPFVNMTVTILGQVKNSGALAFPLNGDFDLMTAIAMAGGFTQLADLKKVSVTRAQNKTVYDVRKLVGNGNAAIKLQPNDIISVAERWF